MRAFACVLVVLTAPVARAESSVAAPSPIVAVSPVAAPSPVAVTARVECAPIAGGDAALGHIDADTRLGFLRANLARGARRARLWSWGWAGIYSGLTIGSLALLPTKTANEKVDSYLGAAASFVGVAILIVSPMKITFDQTWLERRLRTAPAGTDRCALVADAERLLIRDAADADLGRQPFVHVFNFLFNIGVGLALGIGFGHWDEAALTAGVGVALGEAQILTRPMDTVETLRRYRLGGVGPLPPSNALRWSLVPVSTSPRNLGLAFGVAF